MRKRYQNAQTERVESCFLLSFCDNDEESPKEIAALSVQPFNMLLRPLIAASILLSLASPVQAEQSLGEAIKKIFATPTPTPRPRKRKSATTRKSSTPTPSPPRRASPAREEESPTPSASHLKKKKKPATEEEETPSPTPASKKKKTSPTPTPTASPHRKKKASPSPEPSETPARSTSPTETPTPLPTATPDESPSPTKPHRAPNATLTPDQIKGFDDYPPKVQKLLGSALELTARNLTYQYGSADPDTGGMDCSGFVYFVLRQNEITDVPRDSSGQYVWLRRAHEFEPVISEKDDSFELDNMKPGDLLFWTGTYSIERDPPITHAMIYLGREKKTGGRVMVGASDGRVYQGESRNGVSVFDFKIHRAGKSDDGKRHPTFVGYGHIPGLRD